MEGREAKPSREDGVEELALAHQHHSIAAAFELLLLLLVGHAKEEEQHQDRI